MSNRVVKKREFVTDSGEVFPLLPVGQNDLIPFVKKLTQGLPKPPLELIDGVLVPNEAHEDYKAAIEAFEIEKGPYMLALIVELGLDLDLDDEQQAVVDRAKKKMERLNPGAIENGFDFYLYAKSVCANTDEFTRLVEAIQSLNNPTAEAVQDALDTFRPDVPRATNNGNQNAPVGNRVPDWQPAFNSLQSGEVGGDRLDNFLRENSPRVAG